MRRTFVAIGIVATTSLALALMVMTLLVDAPLVARWFLVSAVLAGASFLAAIVLSRWSGDEGREP